MRSFGFGLSSLTLITLTITAVACGGSKTIYVDNGGGTDNSSGGDSTSGGTTNPTDPGPGTTDPGPTGDPTDPTTPAPALVQGLDITDIAFYQGTKVPVVTSGAPIAKASRNAPVVVGRDAMVRVFVKPGSGYSASAVTAELVLVSGTTRLATIKDTAKTISSASTDADTTSTFNFDVPAADLPAGVSYQVFLTDPSGAVPTGTVTSRYPNAGGVQDLQAEASGGVKVVIVPVQSGSYLPDVSATQLAAYKEAFMARYPTTDVTITARATWSYSGSISASGNGFSQALNAITQLRKSDGVSDDTYYYGAFAPASSFNSYCGGGCVTGLSSVVESPSTQDAFMRASVGIGFTGTETMETAVHEVGHAHGRNHAPCGGASGVDPNFPYSDGSIGTWGYDIIAKKLVDPSVATDMMGYCQTTWLSDYTFAALFDRIAQVNGGVSSAKSGNQSALKSSGTAAAAPGAAQTYKMATVDGAGTMSWTGDIDLKEEPGSQDVRAVQFMGSAGELVGTHTAHFYKYDHLPGGILVMPSSPFAAQGVTTQVAKAWTQVKVAGAANILAR